MDKKIVFFSFNESKMCFMHVLLNLLDMNEKGIDARLVMEGASTKLAKDLSEEENPLFKKVVEKGLLDSICKACANQMGVLDYIENETDLPLNGDMEGHPPMEPYIKEDYSVISL